MNDRYIQIEVDEHGHRDYACFDEDTRLEIIAADVGMPGVVVRIDPDSLSCFRRKRLGNGEYVEHCIAESFHTLLNRAAHATRTAMIGPVPSGVERVFVDAQ